MPAIKYHQRGNQKPSVVNHYRDFLAHCLPVRTSSGGFADPPMMGFVCNAGASHMKGGKIARVKAVSISRGDGSTEQEWESVPDGEFVLGWILPAGPHLTEVGDLYILVDDDGWPMTTLRKISQTIVHFGERDGAASLCKRTIK